MLSEVNPFDARISERECMALQLMLQKRESYVSQGRSREAHGMGTAIWILWKTLIHEAAGNTGYGSL
jgi:hypothetical protein